MKTQRPKAILWFERFLLMAVLGTLIGIVVSFREYVEYYSGFTEDQMTYVYISWGIFCVSWVTFLLSAYFAARRAKTWAKWTFVANCLLALLIFSVSITYASGMGLAAYLLIHVLIALSAGCLFLPSARAWFNARPSSTDHSQLGKLGDRE